MAELLEVRNHLQALLRVADTPDYPPAHNGVQLANDGYIGKVGAAVTPACPSFNRLWMPRSIS